jgi:CRP-like cAMP-binding protein
MDLITQFRYFENVESYEAGKIIFEEGKPGEHMYVIMDGEVDIRVKGISIYRAGAGELVGEMALIDSERRSATAVALENTRLVPVGEQQFLYMVQETPQFALHVLRVLVGRLRHMDESI